jgi:hypothetical protein
MSVTENHLCTIDGCTRALRARGWCATHWARWKANGDPLTVTKPATKTSDTCDAPDCTRPTPTGTYCNMHRNRLSRTGQLGLTRAPRGLHSQGYVIIQRKGHPVVTDAHGWVYEHRVVLHDAIGPGWHPCHHCGMQVSWELTYPRSLDALVVDHLDENKTNNTVENLVPSCAPCNFARSNRWVKQRRKQAAT